MYFAYIRVSTDKQGEHGVSLQEQRDILQRYASHKGLQITQWFEEKETASKVGRPVFNAMVSLLKSGAAAGVIIHKVDRGARNFRDWAVIGELVQAGIDVHFATESLDLTTLGGMLSADLQAVMSVHYSRNLREEVKKGYYGRLKQGLCPYPAPLGYLNNGAGKPKTVDPVQGSIVRKAFELYANGRYSLDTLASELYHLGLRTRETPKNTGGMKVSRNTISDILSNPFYMGVLYLKKTNGTFAGIHEPLITRQLFEKVQQVKSGKYVRQVQVHNFLFSRLIVCHSCGRALIGEAQKHRIYYRCHRKHDKPIGIRSDRLEKKIASFFERLRLSPEEVRMVDIELEHMRKNNAQQCEEAIKQFRMALQAVQQKNERITDIYIDGLLNRAELEQKKTALILERREIEGNLSELERGKQPGLARLEKIVELIKTASLLYEKGSDDDKRELIKEVMSNRVASHKSLEIVGRNPFESIVNRHAVRFGGPLRGRSRTFWRKVLQDIPRHPPPEVENGESLSAA